jgi:phosphoribosylaminoimidazole carboxylase (NCAIR synthetase)
MSCMLILAREGRHSLDLAGRSVLADLPFDVVVLANRQAAPSYAGCPPNVQVEVVRWSDEASVYEAARRWHETEGVFAIATNDEMVVGLAAELREALGIKGFHPDDARKFRDKVEMKHRLGAAGLRVPQFCLCDDAAQVQALLARHGRLVVKPVAGQGSRQVEFIDTTAEWESWREANVRQLQGFEAEEFIDGTLYHVNALVVDGKAVLTASAPYLPGMGNIDFASGSPFVSLLLRDGDLKARLQNFSDDVIEELGMVQGVTHLECFVTAAGEIVFCEIAARPGGGGIVLMIEAQYGVNYAHANLLLEGGRADLVRVPRTSQQLAGLMGMRLPKAGFVTRMPPPDSFKEDWIHLFRPEALEGDFRLAAEHCTDYVALLVFSGAGEDEFHARRAGLYSRFYSQFELNAL